MAIAPYRKRAAGLNQQPLIKALAMPGHTSPEGGVTPAFRLLLTGFVSHRSSHLPAPVSVADFAQRFPRQPGEYQQRETHNQYAPNESVPWQLHSLLLLSTQSRSGTFPAIQKCHYGCEGRC